MARVRSQHRDDYEVTVREPSLPAIIALAAVAIVLALGLVVGAGAVLFG